MWILVVLLLGLARSSPIKGYQDISGIFIILKYMALLYLSGSLSAIVRVLMTSVLVRNNAPF